MMPDPSLRLANAMKALTEVVLPALPADAHFAREQVHLTLGHLHIVAQQWPLALRFELGSYNAICALATSLRPHLANSVRTTAIDQALAQAANLDRSDYAAVSAAQRSFNALVSAAITDDDNCAPLPVAIQQAVLTYGERQALRQRTWLADCGVDPDRTTLPALTDVLDG